MEDEIVCTIVRWDSLTAFSLSTNSRVEIRFATRIFLGCIVASIFKAPLRFNENKIVRRTRDTVFRGLQRQDKPHPLCAGDVIRVPIPDDVRLPKSGSSCAVGRIRLKYVALEDRG